MAQNTLKHFLTFTGLIIISLIIILSTLPSVSAATPTLYAEAAILMDADTGQILYSKNPNQKMASASLTKIMACL